MESFGRRRFGGGSRRGFGGGGSSSQDKPVKEGETYDVEIIEVGSRGDGLAKIQNFVIFVPNTQKGQKVKIKITQVRSNSAVAEVVSEGDAEEAESATEAESTDEFQNEPQKESKEKKEGEDEEDEEDEPEEQPAQPAEIPEEKPEEE